MPEDSIIHGIFDRQHALAVKYGPIETKNGHYYPPLDPVPNINDGLFQRWIKDMFWRTTEEIAEAMEVAQASETLADWKAAWANNVDLRHFFEELADSVHFLTEVSIVCNVHWSDVDTQMMEVYQTSNYEQDPGLPVPSLKERVADVVIAIGLTANTLKNKPWKTTQMVTDVLAFRSKLLYAWSRMFVLWRTINATPEDLFVLYCKKHAVNQFRQDSNY